MSFQLVLVVTNASMPAERSSCGSAGLKPKQSGSHPTRARTPRCRSNQRWPCRSWRASDSPVLIAVSCSTHVPPSTSQRASATRSRRRAKPSGSSSAYQAWSAADDWPKAQPSRSSRSPSTVPKVRRALRRVSSTGQSQARSMWAWPTAATRPRGGSVARAPCSAVRSRRSASRTLARAASSSGISGSPSPSGGVQSRANAPCAAKRGSSASVSLGRCRPCSAPSAASSSASTASPSRPPACSAAIASATTASRVASASTSASSRTSRVVPKRGSATGSPKGRRATASIRSPKASAGTASSRW